MFTIRSKIDKETFHPTLFLKGTRLFQPQTVSCFISASDTHAWFVCWPFSPLFATFWSVINGPSLDIVFSSTSPESLTVSDVSNTLTCTCNRTMAPVGCSLSASFHSSFSARVLQMLCCGLWDSEPVCPYSICVCFQCIYFAAGSWGQVADPDGHRGPSPFQKFDLGQRPGIYTNINTFPWITATTITPSNLGKIQKLMTKVMEEDKGFRLLHFSASYGWAFISYEALKLTSSSRPPLHWNPGCATGYFSACVAVQCSLITYLAYDCLHSWNLMGLVKFKRPCSTPEWCHCQNFNMTLYYHIMVMFTWMMLSIEFQYDLVPICCGIVLHSQQSVGEVYSVSCSCDNPNFNQTCVTRGPVGTSCCGRCVGGSSQRTFLPAVVKVRLNFPMHEDDVAVLLWVVIVYYKSNFHHTTVILVGQNRLGQLLVLNSHCSTRLEILVSISLCLCCADCLSGQLFAMLFSCLCSELPVSQVQ